jgi:chromosomal replication initiator protein
MESTRTRTPQEIWETALGELQVQVSKANYRTWLSKTVGIGYLDKKFVIGVPNTFAAEYLEKNQRSLIEKSLTGLTTPDIQVVFQVNGKPHLNSRETTAPAIPTPAPVYTRLNPAYAFDSFVEGSGNRLARAAALSVAQNPGHSYNPLFIYGGAGLGKTHLLHAIGQAAAANHINVICTSAEQFTNEFVTALRERNTEEFRNKYRSIGMLLIDDIQFISGKEQTEESFFHTFNELHNTNRQIVITSDCPPKSMPLLEERLRSRFEWGLIVDIKPPDYETRLAILESKAKQKGISIGTDVLELIARNAQTNVRVLEGSLNRVVAFAKLLRVTPTVDIAAKALEDVASKEHSTGDITAAAIVEAVAESFQLSKEELAGRKRDKDTTLARRLAMYLIRQETNYSLAEIGKELGNRDAAAVTAACKQISGKINENPYLKRKIHDIRRQIHPKADTKD